MVKQQLVETILEPIPVRADIAHFVEVESKITSSVEYEETVLAVCHRLAHALITQTQGIVPKSRNAKKNPDVFRQSNMEKGACPMQVHTTVQKK